METTDYFTTSVMVRRPYLKMKWIEYVLNSPNIMLSLIAVLSPKRGGGREKMVFNTTRILICFT
ncbi:MAG: hypothetical protein AAGB97_10040 [Dehalococcoidia bacterium]|nr:hypothetical protein [Chloroflexota bacterium]MBT9161546.1 hypothetical protein [Chloroflexota bacterium]